MTLTAVSDHCLHFIKKKEGFRPDQYLDGKGGPGKGVPTIGYGTTAADTHPHPLPAHLSEPEAAHLLQVRVNGRYLPPVAHAMTPMNPTRNMIEACVSFAYNIGPAAFQGAPNFEHITAALKARSAQNLADALLLYDNPNDPNVHKGLKLRRQEERAWFLHPDDKPLDPFAGYPAAEVDAIREYDRLLRDDHDPGRRGQLRDWMKQRCAEIRHAAGPKADGGDGRGWHVNQRQERFHSLTARSS